MKGLALKIFRWWCAFVAHWFKRQKKTPDKTHTLKNTDRHISRLLENIGVRNRTDLVKLGALEAYQQLIDAGYQVNTNLVLELHGLITDQNIEEIPDKQIAYLLEEATALRHTVR
ncbi:MAG: TfoX C-terminal domain [Deinococcota bacterium]|jgi:hypothetical protein